MSAASISQASYGCFTRGVYFVNQEERIRQLCSKVVALQGSDQFQPAVCELRAAMHDYISRARDRVADLAFVAPALESEPKGSD